MMEDIEIGELGRRVKNGDKDAFKYLYIKYFRNFQSFAMRYVYDWNEAENIVQESYISLWSSIPHYNPEQSILTYLFSIVKNASLKYIRNLQIRDKNKTKLIEAMLFSNITMSEPDEELIVRLNSILAKLPEKQRIVLMKHTVERMTLAEIAIELNVAESTVKTHFKRAIAILRENILYILFGVISV